ncbi:MAG: hypothetical protein K0Q49_1365 [Haloplasmataceae bacterium]|jgi:uncharacterized RDD family membrane protein YckC|nr:hypothetical protein [Haloplasmataceae bacterium]
MFVRKKYLVLDRLLALIYDLIFIGLSLLVIILGYNYLNTNIFKFGTTLKNIILIFICFLVYLIEFTVLPLLIKSTVGKYLTELEIISTQGKITFGRLLFREMILKHILYLSVIGFIADCFYFMVKKQTIHDFLLKTSVIHKEI